MRRTSTLWLLAAAGWLAYTLALAGQLVGVYWFDGKPLGPAQALRLSAAGMLPWIPVSVALYALVERFPLERTCWRRSLPVLSVAVVAVVLLRAAYVGLLDPLLHYWYPETPDLAELLLGSASHSAPLCCVVIGIVHAPVYAERARRQRARIGELEAGLTRARLDALAAQLNPHFLFNALNSIAELIHYDADAAEHALLSLSALLRRSLSNSTRQEVRLADEVALLRHYLSIEQIRLGKRLQLDWRVDAGCLDFFVPALLLQPLVENAIVHGITPRRRPGSIAIGAAAEAGQLTLSVVSDGVAGPADAVDRGFGIGLANTRARLRCLYGDAWRLDLQTDAAGHTEVRVCIPQHTTPSQTQAEPA
jgi:hypothetical protein